MAPERMLVFVLRASLQNFANAIRKVTGLELIDEDDFDPDDEDKNPSMYLLVPDAVALTQIVSLWQHWQRREKMARGFTPWNAVFDTLKELRVWGPQDRVNHADRRSLQSTLDTNASSVHRLEVELVFRRDSLAAERAETQFCAKLQEVGGTVVQRSRIDVIGYHALLIEIDTANLKVILQLLPDGLAGDDSVMHIRPQSLANRLQTSDAERSETFEQVKLLVAPKPPILALIDGVPVANHGLLAGAVLVEDIFDLERQTIVSEREHGTAMASLIVHGDRNNSELPLERKIVAVPVMGPEDKFTNDALIVDVIYQAVRHLVKVTPNLLIVNLSLANQNQIFQGRMSAWARLIDRFAYEFGLLFLVSAGNHPSEIRFNSVSTRTDFEDMESGLRASATIDALGSVMAERRLMSPAETVNGLTIGAANLDAVQDSHRQQARLNIDPYKGLILSNPSSALGPGFARSVKPDLLMPGAKEHLSVNAAGKTISVSPCPPARAHGLRVAAPQENTEHYSGATSGATALASRACHQIYDALEAHYGDVFLALPKISRAALLKALLVHTASWPEESANAIKRVLGPADNRQHVKQKDNVRRFLGYGFGDPERAIACTGDRATFWATGHLAKEKAVLIQVPIPECVFAKARPQHLVATLAWFTPIAYGRQSYRTVRLKLDLIDGEEKLRINPSSLQPDEYQSSKGTVISRRWDGSRAVVAENNQYITFRVQREPDRNKVAEGEVSFAIALTFSMPGVVDIYDQIRARVEANVAVQI